MMSPICIPFSFGVFYWFRKRHTILDTKLQGAIRELELAEKKPNDPQLLMARLASAKALKKEAKKNGSSRLINSIEILKSRILSLQYRLDIHQRAQPADTNLFNQLKKAAEIWKLNEKLIKVKDLSDGDIDQLKELCTYPKFAKHLLKSESERASFFNWCIRAGNKASPYVEFIGMAKRLLECNLSMRIGSFGGSDLQICTSGNSKDLLLPFEGKLHSVLDDNLEIAFKGNYKLKIHQILQIFQDRNFTVGNLEYFPHEGICNWNPKKLGWYNADTKLYEMINLANEVQNWWEQLKPMEMITKEQASLRFEDFAGKKLSCDGVHWVGSLISRTDYHLPDAEGNHAYVQFAVPDGNGNYRLYDFGKFTDWFPQTMRQRLDFIAKPVKGTITYPDENRFRLDRDVESVSFLFSPAEGVNRMNSIRKDLLNVRQGNHYFEVLHNNCILWACKKLKLSKEQIHKMCGINIMEGSPRGALGKIWTFLKLCPGSIHRVFLSTLFVLIGARGSVVVLGKCGKHKVRCLMNDPPWAPGAIRPHPTALLIKKRKLQS